MAAASTFSLEYAQAGVPVREDLRAAQHGLLDTLRAPGCWLDGAQRMAIARESRLATECRMCRERADALSPDHVGGNHDRHESSAGLDEAFVELAHRLRVDSGRLSRAWFERTRDGCGGDGPYVEAVGVVALLAGIDFFCRAAGLDPFPLPEPAPGAPTGYRPEGLREGIAWVPMLAPEDASGPEADLYAGAKGVPNIARALSMVPDHARLLQSLTRSHYLALPDMSNPLAGRAIDRMQMELVAARVSALNECFY